LTKFQNHQTPRLYFQDEEDEEPQQQHAPTVPDEDFFSLILRLQGLHFTNLFFRTKKLDRFTCLCDDLAFFNVRYKECVGEIGLVGSRLEDQRASLPQ